MCAKYNYVQRNCTNMVSHYADSHNISTQLAVSVLL